MADAMRITGARISVPNLDLRYKVSQIFAHIVKFAVDSAVDGSRILIPGRKHAHRTLQEGLMDVPAVSTPLKAKKTPDVKVANNIPFQMKMPEVEEHLNNLKQRYESSPKCADGSQRPMKPSDDDLKGVDIMKKNGRRRPNCGNAFQVFKSLNDDLQLCPFCGLPFSVVSNEFVKDSVKFSNQSTPFGEAFNNFSSSRDENHSIRATDIEADVD